MGGRGVQEPQKVKVSSLLSVDLLKVHTRSVNWIPDLWK